MAEVFGPGTGDQQRVVLVCITHFVDTALEFIPAAQRVADVQLVLPKPKSIVPSVLEEISEEGGFTCEPLSREIADDPSKLAELINAQVAPERDVVLMDVGGYFAPHLDALLAEIEANVLGVVEGTENGLVQYELIGELPVPVYSVARSPLKYPENHLVGSGVVFSIEALLREQGRILQGKRAAVIGYGKIGRGVAAALRSRHIETIVYDRNPVALAEAAAHGFQISTDKKGALGGIDLVVSATGAAGLAGSDFRSIAANAFIATVTSADDELDMPALEAEHELIPLTEHLTECRGDGRSFYLLNKGNAVNFLHGAVLGPSIHLVEGEKLACIPAIQNHTEGPGIFEVREDVRSSVATTWLEFFTS